MKKFGYLAIPLIILMVIFFTAKEKSIDDYAEEIDSAIQTSINEYISERQGECREKIMVEADLRVDSVLQKRALDMFSQKTNVGSDRIFRPDIPKIELEPDSSPISPLFRDSLN